MLKPLLYRILLSISQPKQTAFMWDAAIKIPADPTKGSKTILSLFTKAWTWTFN